jgi:F5/8 type C domain-containing protein
MSQGRPVTSNERPLSHRSPASSTGSGLRAAYRKLALAAELENARREGFAEGRPGHAEFALGRAALIDARALAASRDGVGSALLLYRASLRLFALAQQARGGSSQLLPRPTGDSALDPSVVAQAPVPPMGTAVLEGLGESLSPEQRRSLERVLDPENGENELASLGEAERQRLLPYLERLAVQLGEPLELAADRVRRVEAASWMRRTLVAVIVIIAVAWATYSLFGRKNLALNKAVTTSSADPKVGKIWPRALVDGDRKNLGFHTLKGRGQFATIDLGAVESIQLVEVYNRLDCCQARAVPLRIDVSIDGVSWATLGRRLETFVEWSVRVAPTPARFVRLTDEGANIFHLNEVAIY